MGDYHYEPLSLTDYAFLAQETPELHMSVIGVTIFESGKLSRPGGGVDFDTIKAETAAAVELVPRYRQKLMWRVRRERAGQLDRRMIERADESLPPVWVDDPHFDIDYHMRHTALPRPGGDAQLKTLVGRIASQQLDRSRPLWETWIVEGLEGGRFAMVSKLHHCMIDGKSGADITQLMSSITPDFVPRKATRWTPRPAPTAKQLEREMKREQRTAPLRLAQNLRRLGSESGDFRGEIARRVKGLREAFAESAGMKRTPTPLNGRNGPHRAVDWMQTPLTRIKAISKALDCTVNDVVLTVVTGAFREYLLNTDFVPGSAPFRANVPVSIWSERKKGEVGNQIMTWMIELPLGERDPVAQLRAIHKVTAKLKKSDKALGVKTLESFLRYTPGLLSLATRNAVGPLNTLVTNIPGPQMALYQMGAKMVESYPIVPMLVEMGLGIGVMSYNGTMFWGVTVDKDIVPDVDAFIAALSKSVDAVEKAARGAPAKVAPRKPAAKRAAPVAEKKPSRKPH
jgi:WS/DGAT/MGAT family acyltransferase